MNSALYYITVKGCKKSNELQRLNKVFEEEGIIDNYVCIGEYDDRLNVFFDSYKETLWHSYESDMRKISIMFPNMVFRVEVNSIVANYVHYFTNGSTEICGGYIKYDVPETIKW